VVHSGIVLENARLADKHHRLTLWLPEAAQQAQPGQFLHVACDGPGFVVRRPFSVHAVHAGSVSILLQVKGSGTSWLAERGAGDRLDVMGPLGAGFRLEPGYRNVLCVAGGVGVAPILFLAQRCREEGRKVTVLLGARTADLVLAKEDLEAAGAEVLVATEDGSYGYRGTVVDLLSGYLEGACGSGGKGPVHCICACGPRPMLAKVADMARREGIPCLVSLEERMACGIGACMGCVVPLREPGGGFRYASVCREGPVFPAERVVFS